MVAVPALQARVAGVLTCLQAAEAGGKRLVQAVQHILQDLRVEVAVVGPHRLDDRGSVARQPGASASRVCGVAARL